VPPLLPAEPEEVKPPSPAEPEKVSPPPPTEPEEVKPPLPEEVPPPTPTEVKPPPPEEVKRPPPKEVKPPRCKVALQPMVAVCAPALSVEDASWLVKLFHEAFVKLQKVAVHLGVQPPSHLLQTTVKDYAFKINVLVGDLERGMLAPVDDDGGDDGGLDVSGSGSNSESDGGAPPVATTSG
jgi:hypothetical protein